MKRINHQMRIMAFTCFYSSMSGMFRKRQCTYCFLLFYLLKFNPFSLHWNINLLGFKQIISLIPRIWYKIDFIGISNRLLWTFYFLLFNHNARRVYVLAIFCSIICFNDGKLTFVNSWSYLSESISNNR